MKKISLLLALAGLFLVSKSSAIPLDDIQLWTGSGTNRAALVIEWNTPIVLNDTTVPAPVANKTLVWGYRFNGSATGTQMFNAIVAANPQLYAVETIDPVYGTGITAIGFNLSGSGLAGLTDGTVTNLANTFTNGILTNPNLNADATYSLNSGDLFWSGFYGPYWQLWNELGDNGGFLSSPNRGTNQFWDADVYTHGQWASAYSGLDDLQLTNGSWIGFSISAAGYTSDTNDPAYNAFNYDEQAPPSPDGTYVAYVGNTNDFAVQIVSTNNVYSQSPYNDPAAILNRPALKFLDVDDFDEDVTDRVKIAEPPYNVAPDGSDVITEISAGGQITVKLGRKIYDDPNNPYGTDLIVYGNSFIGGHGISLISDETDLGAYFLGSGIYGHPTTISVSQDGTNWFTYSNTPTLFPDEAYHWDDTNSSWTDEEMNPTKPLNPFIYTNNFTGQSAASGLDQFIGAAGGSGYDLKASGLPWIQYVRVEPGTGTYTVIDAIAAVNPVVVGDALSITPDNLASGITNLDFQNPADLSQNQIIINFDSISANAKVSTVSLNEFSSFAPVVGNVSSAYQLTLKPVTGTDTINYVVDIGLRAGENYSGKGNDLRVYQWSGTNWDSQPFNFNPANDEVFVAGVTNFSAWVVSQIVPPQLSIQAVANGFAFQFTPVANSTNILERSSNLVTWTPVAAFAATNAQPVTLQDTDAPNDKAFYRVRLNVP
jgi:hypothetical protein